MIRRLILGGTAAAFLLTGCGGGSGGGTSGGGTAPSTSAGTENPARTPIQLQVSQCFRVHGQPSFPDPTQNPDGSWAVPNPGGVQPTVPPACESLVRRMKSEGGAHGRGDQPLSPADMGKARDFAKCMREKGISDWPDPNTNGYFVLPPRLGPPNGKRLFKQQMAACRSFEPTGGVHMVLH